MTGLYLTKSENNSKNLLATLFIIIAIISFIFAIVCFNMKTEATTQASKEWDEYYGGDAYTGIQHAAAQTANNVMYLDENVRALSECITTIAGFVFIIVSLVFASLGGYKISQIINDPSIASKLSQIEKNTNVISKTINEVKKQNESECEDNTPEMDKNTSDSNTLRTYKNVAESKSQTVDYKKIVNNREENKSWMCECGYYNQASAQECSHCFKPRY